MKKYFFPENICNMFCFVTLNFSLFHYIDFLSFSLFWVTLYYCSKSLLYARCIYFIFHITPLFSVVFIFCPFLCCFGFLFHFFALIYLSSYISPEFILFHLLLSHSISSSSLAYVLISFNVSYFEICFAKHFPFLFHLIFIICNFC